MSSTTGGHLVAQTLHHLGVTTLFSVSGNQILPLYDAAGEHGLRIIHLRHESAAAYAAAAYAEIKNQPGILLVSAGPAFVAALAGVAAAQSLELPLLFLSGASATSEQQAGGFQDIDQQTIARPLCKTSLHITATEQIQPIITQAWNLAQTNIPGPVHISLPANILRATASHPSTIEPSPLASPMFSAAEQTTLQTIAHHLTHARRPLIIARPSAARESAGQALSAIARHLHIEPIITESPRGLRDLKYREIIRHYPESDAALVIGPADFTVGFLAPATIATQGHLFLIDAPGEPQPHRLPEIHIQIPPALALPYLQAHISESPAVEDQWERLWSHPLPLDLPAKQPAIHPLEVAAQVRQLLQPDDVIILDGGEFCQWIRLGLRHIPNRIIWNSRFGGIGGSIPMAVGVAAANHPGRTIAFLGDGAAGYHLSEWETAARYHLPLLTIIGNDARWAAEWFQQATTYGPARTFETALSPARYDQAAIALGASGTHITTRAALQRTLAASITPPGPVCLNIRILSLPSPAVEP